MSYAVGSLVSARGREWVVLPDSSDQLLMVRPLGGGDDEATGILLSLEGADVHEARFGPPDPAHAGDFRSSRPLIDALRLGFRSSAGPFRSFGRIGVTPRPYQLVPLLMALRLDPVRLLIADDVGVGKTIEALLIARELLDQGDVRRSAVLCSPQLAEQWQRELRDKFHLDARLVLPSTVTRLERRLGVGQSLFEVYPHTVVSTDYIKSDRRRHDFLRAAPELVIVDEAHTCVDASVGRGRHQRHELLRGLAADRARHLLLLTATPHSGRREAFGALLALLDDRLVLDGDAAGSGEPWRAELARHFVQRRRADIRGYLHEETTFPRRETAEATYQLSDDYRRLFDRVLAFARETVRDPSGGAHRQRVRWWSALALLRALASSPAAAAATLRNRAGPADTATPEEADEVGRRTVLDQSVDDSAEAADVPAGSDDTDPRDGGEEAARTRRRLHEFARAAERLAGRGDAKLAKAERLVRGLLDDGFHPIVFCRFIPTAEYVAQALRGALRKQTTVAAITGLLPPDERERRIAELGASDGPRVLVATDCLSEGINLQQHFDAVVHYDLSWNPTRHEQREGRVDRFGQPAPVVRALTYYGIDNRIDEIVIDVLLRKHEQIRRDLGICVPVPADSGVVVEAIMEGLLLSGDPRQLRFDELVAREQQALAGAWEDAADRQRRSRTRFAQQTIKVEEVARQLAATRRAVGSERDTEQFVRDAVIAVGGLAVPRGDPLRGDGLRIDLSEAAPAARDAVGGQTRLEARFGLPAGDHQVYLSRTHPFVEGLARHVLDSALDELGDGVATRCGAIRTRAVARRTTLLLARFRFHLLVHSDGADRPLLAEDARVLGFAGSPEQAEWLDPEQAEALFAARPEASIGVDQARRFVARVVDGWEHLRPHLDAEAGRLARTLLDEHRAVRDAARRKGVRFDVRPHLPADLLGIYVLLPLGEEA